MAVTEESQSTGPFRGLVSIHGFDNAQTVKATADVQSGIVPAGSAVVLKKDGTATVHVNEAGSFDTGTGDEPATTTDRLGFTKSERRSDADGQLNVATLLHCTVRVSELSDTAQATVAAAETAGALGGINLYHQ